MPEVIVTGLAEIQRSLALSGPAVEKAMKVGLREAAEPVSRLAEAYSLGRIRNMNPAWAANRVGVLRKGVYIVPKQRGVRPGDPRRRPNLVETVLAKAYEPALEAGEPIVRERVTRLVGEVTRAI